MFKIGDKVRVKKSVDNPSHGWGEVTHNSVGVVVEVSPMGVDFGGNYTWSAYPTEVELINKEVTTMRPIKKIEIAGIIPRRRRYKLVKLVDDEYLSVIAGTGSFVKRPMLKYETGRVTEAPAFPKANKDTEANKLIYVYDSLTQAIADADRLGTSEAKASHTRAILEVLPVGFMRANRKVEGVTMCEAVLVGKEAWGHTPEPKIVEEWVDISDCIDTEMEDGVLKLYDGDEGDFIATIGACGIQGEVAEGYKLTPLSDQTYKVERLDEIDPDDC